MTIEPLGSAMAYQAQTQTPKASESIRIDGMESRAVTDTMAADQSKIAMNEMDPQSDEKQSKQQESTSEDMKSKVDQVNKLMDNSEIVFGIHDKTNRLLIKIIDKGTKKTIKEFPPEKNLDTFARILEMAGLLVDEKR